MSARGLLLLPLLLLAAPAVATLAEAQEACPGVALQLEGGPIERRAGETATLTATLGDEGARLRNLTWQAEIARLNGSLVVFSRVLALDAPSALTLPKEPLALAVPLPADLPPGAFWVYVTVGGEWACGDGTDMREDAWREIPWEPRTRATRLLVHAPDDTTRWLMPGPGLPHEMQVRAGERLRDPIEVVTAGHAYRNVSWLLHIVMVDADDKVPVLPDHERWIGEPRPGRHILWSVEGPQDVPPDNVATIDPQSSRFDLPEGRYAIALAFSGDLVLPDGHVLSVFAGSLEMHGASRIEVLPPGELPMITHIEEPWLPIPTFVEDRTVAEDAPPAEPTPDAQERQAERAVAAPAPLVALALVAAALARRTRI